MKQVIIQWLIISVFPLVFCDRLAVKNICKAVSLDEARYNSQSYNATEQCGGTGYVMDCSGAGLTRVPKKFPVPKHSTERMCLLDLSGNRIGKLTNDTFESVASRSIRFLYLYNNQIEFLESGSFRGLQNLRYLNLSENSLNWTVESKASLSHGVFKPLKKLKWINLNENPIKTFDGLDYVLKDLVSLEGLYLNGCEGCKFGRGISRLKNLKTLHFGARSEKSCYMPNITDDLFENFEGLKITNISLLHCNLQNISYNAFRPFNRSLVRLDLSYNEDLTFSGMDRALTGLVNSTRLTTLDVIRIHTQYERGTILEKEHVKSLQTLKNLSNLFLDLNKLEVIDIEILSNQLLPKSLRKLTLAGNRLSRGRYLNYVPDVSGIETLDLSRQHLYYDPFFNNHFNPAGLAASKCDCYIKGVECFKINLPKGLKRVYWKESFLHFEIPYTRVCNGDKLLSVDLSSNKIYSLDGPVEGVSSVEFVAMSSNDISYISDKFLTGFVNLKYLNLSNNKVGPSLNEYGTKPFWNAVKLETLDLAYNKISYLYPDLFINLTSLIYLNLKYNELDTWKIDFRKSICLRTLDIAHNKFDNVPESLQKTLDILSTSQCKTNDSMLLNMSRNPIQCNCHTVPFIKWMLHSDIHISLRGVECSSQNGDRLSLRTSRDAIRILSELEKKCVEYGWLIATITSVIGCFISSIITMLLYRKRWKLRHLYYSRRRRHRHHGYQRVFTYDAFVSYSEDRGSFIKHFMVPALEENRGLKLWIGDRDSYPGASVAENIAHAIYNSKRSVHLIDNEYMDDKWCDYEIHMANQEAVDSKRNFLIFILMDTDHTNIPLNIMRLLDSEESLVYPIDGNEDEKDAFWTHLSDILTSE